jgi:hypothetical protein
MKKNTTKLFTHIGITLCLLGLILNTNNCNCSNSQDSPSTTDPDKDPKKESNELNVALTANDPGHNNNIINFQLTNKGATSIDLSKVDIQIDLSDKKDQDNNETTCGKLSYQRHGMTICCQGISISVENLTGMKTLDNGQCVDINLSIVDIGDLASATVTCKLVNGKNADGTPITKSVTATFDDIGPKADSRIEHTLGNPEELAFDKDGNLILPIAFKNMSDHNIDLNQLKHELKILQNGTSIYEVEYAAGEISWPNSILSKATSQNLNYSLPQSTTQEILQKYDANYTFEFVTKSAKDDLEIGSVNQNFKVKVGPIPGESTVEINVHQTIDIDTHQNGSGSQLTFYFTVKNTSDHPLDFNKVTFDIITNIKVGEQPGIQILNNEFLLTSNIPIATDKENTVPLTIDFPNIPLQNARNAFSDNSNHWTLKVVIKTKDNGSEIGTAEGRVKAEPN